MQGLGVAFLGRGAVRVTSAMRAHLRRKATSVARSASAVIAAAAKAAQWAYAASLAYVWYTSIAFGVLSIVACLFLGQVRPYLTHRIAVELA